MRGRLHPHRITSDIASRLIVNTHRASLMFKCVRSDPCVYANGIYQRAYSYGSERERWNDDHFVCHISLRWYRQASVLPDTALEDRYCRASSQGPQPPSRADDYSHTEMQRTDLHDERNRGAPKTWPSLSEPFTRLFLQPLVFSPLAFRLARNTRLQRSGRLQICRVVVGEVKGGARCSGR